MANTWYEKKQLKKHKRQIEKLDKDFEKKDKVLKRADNIEWPNLEDLSSVEIVYVSSIKEFTVEVLKINGSYLKTFVSPKLNPLLVYTLVVGDKVALDNENYISYQLPRSSYLSRVRSDATRRSELAKKEHVLAANVDIGVIVVSASNPPFHPALIDRYLILMKYGQIQPVIVLNKSDLIDTPYEVLDYYRNVLKIPVVIASTKTNIGIKELKILIQEKVSVFVGHSGVGKSSLVNALYGKPSIRVGDVNDKTGKGTHTTTSSQMYELFENTFVIDTPGIRALDISLIQRFELKNCFDEFKAYESACKFDDCLHYKEIGCAVKQAVESGLIHPQRYDSYIKLLEELK